MKVVIASALALGLLGASAADTAAEAAVGVVVKVGANHHHRRHVCGGWGWRHHVKYCRRWSWR